MSPIQGKVMSQGPSLLAVSEAQQLRAHLNSIHQQILSSPGANPSRWQALLKDYAVSASALYLTLLPGD